MQRFFVILLITSLLLVPQAKAATGKEFFLSVIYGTLAGTLVGAATLAFTSNPGDNLNNVARGASYGLYAGILLGFYVSYGLNDEVVDPRYPPPPQSFQNQTEGFKVSLIPYLAPSPSLSKDLAVKAQLFRYNF